MTVQKIVWTWDTGIITPATQGRMREGLDVRTRCKHQRVGWEVQADVGMSPHGTEQLGEGVRGSPVSQLVWGPVSSGGPCPFGVSTSFFPVPLIPVPRALFPTPWAARSMF